MIQTKVFVLAAALLGATAAAPASPVPSAAPAAAAAPTPTPDPAILARAKSWYTMLQTGKPDRSQLDAYANSQLNDAQFGAVAAQIAPLGEPVTFEQEKVATQNGSTIYVYLLTYGNSMKLEYIFALDADGKVSGVGLRRPSAEPSP